MPRDPSIKKVLVIGSGPIVIGQAAEFDYAGAQACRSLREEGVEVVLINSNPATIMTDPEMADSIYVEPMDIYFLEQIIRRERPDGILGTMGGQTGLNLLAELHRAGVLETYGVRVLGTPVASVEEAEDRDLFRRKMLAIGEPVPESTVVTEPQQSLTFARKVGFPLIVRPAYTLGGTGGGIAYDERELLEIVRRGIGRSMIGQVLLERCVLGWKELEYEVMRDQNDTCITICNMENIDPMGIHTGESIVVAPSQTLSDEEYHTLRTAALKIIRALDIRGGCNIQFALDPVTGRYFVIEVNPRLSRSSALASKATGYPIARVAAKIALGKHLHEIPNRVTGKTQASFEPALDYVVVKIPRWPFDKFSLADRRIGTQMKSTGEVMAIGRTFEAALNKAIRSLDIGVKTLVHKEVVGYTAMELETALRHATDLRLFAIFEAFRREMLVEEVRQLTSIDPFFLEKMQGLVDMEQALRRLKSEQISREELLAYKRHGFSDEAIAKGIGQTVEAVRRQREESGIRPAYKMVDTCAAEFEAQTPYFYSAYETENEAAARPIPPMPGAQADAKAIVIGSGPIRIGQGIEFDYCTVHAVLALKQMGYRAILINNNPETVSTDFDTSDRLYFEPLTDEDVWEVIESEKRPGVFVQLGGQTAINLADPLAALGARIHGTHPQQIRRAEDRKAFDALLAELTIARPQGRGVVSLDEALDTVRELGYPVLVRPSFVLGGRAMEIVYSDEELVTYIENASDASPDHPILVDKFVPGKEVEVDALRSGGRVFVCGVMEHIEKAGVHSGDSMAVCPPQTLSPEQIETVVSLAERLAHALKIEGFLNIQFVVNETGVQVLEVNPRVSRTVPFLSKVTQLPLVKMGVEGVLRPGALDAVQGRVAEPKVIGIKAPVFSFAKLADVDVQLGPEMKSTGEIMGWDDDFALALWKALWACGLDIKEEGKVLFTIADRDKEEALPLAQRMAAFGYSLLATCGTASFFRQHGLQVESVLKISQGEPNLLDVVSSGDVVLLANTLTPDRTSEREGLKIRRHAVELAVPCVTSLDTLSAIVRMIATRRSGRQPDCRPLYGATDVRPGVGRA